MYVCMCVRVCVCVCVYIYIYIYCTVLLSCCHFLHVMTVYTVPSCTAKVGIGKKYQRNV